MSAVLGMGQGARWLLAEVAAARGCGGPGKGWGSVRVS